MSDDDRMQRMEDKQRLINKDVICILKTWEKFNDEYLPYIQILAQREKEKAELRRAVIKHGTIVAIGALIIFLIQASINEFMNYVKAFK